MKKYFKIFKGLKLKEGNYPCQACGNKSLTRRNKSISIEECEYCNDTGLVDAKDFLTQLNLLVK